MWLVNQNSRPCDPTLLNQPLLLKRHKKGRIGRERTKESHSVVVNFERGRVQKVFCFSHKCGLWEWMAGGSGNREAELRTQRAQNPQVRCRLRPVLVGANVPLTFPLKQQKPPSMSAVKLASPSTSVAARNGQRYFLKLSSILSN